MILPFLLSFTAGYVDTAGFLALQGLFTAHVTGNFVTLGASLALGTSGAIAKILALPVFCAVVMAVRLLSSSLVKRWRFIFEAMLGLKVLLLIVGAALAIEFGPFQNGDSWQAVITGMVLVAAMAIQNAVHRIYLGSVPPSTLMTGTTTQIMIDLADVLLPGGNGRGSTTRLRRMSAIVLVFAAGCGAAALLFMWFGERCFILPPVLGLLSLVARVVGPSEQTV
ncbi:membrane protein [Bradyrhizobium sp. NAS80.1]|uniref:YoaK family protein n=1 Tax=Bradyrhizobium sp. NAS80.1 TaxID=1680159 RepID=UPI0009638AAF|nr:YoaK family protein [Bradyrhizobium sp. NAS80.1]OKO74338.1 membrane protein [Bradyrhizobium sp. NAS80.1]